MKGQVFVLPVCGKAIFGSHPYQNAWVPVPAPLPNVTAANGPLRGSSDSLSVWVSSTMWETWFEFLAHSFGCGQLRVNQPRGALVSLCLKMIKEQIQRSITIFLTVHGKMEFKHAYFSAKNEIYAFL